MDEASTDDTERGRWVAQLCLRTGQRGDALRQYGRAALAGRSQEAGADLAGVRRLAHQRLGSPATPPRRSDAAWDDEACGWIEELRQMETTAAERRP